MTELCSLDAVTLRRMIGNRQISPVEVLKSCIARISEFDPTVNAMPTTFFDRAMVEAEAAEREVMGGHTLGPLHGLPVAVKDLQRTEGVRTTFGSPLHANYVPDHDDRIVAAIRRAGGIIVGKTNTPEFGAGANTTNPVFGPTRNPFDPERICGGSSGGSAVALACGMVPLATGSDTGGSLRIPAGYCGVAGYRPTPGLVPCDTRSWGWSPISVYGPMARTVPDLGLLLSAIDGTDFADPLTCPVDRRRQAATPSFDLTTLCVAISEDLGFAPVSETIRRTFREAVAQIRDVFSAAEERDPPMRDADQMFAVLRAVEYLAAHSDSYHDNRAALGPNIIANVEQGLQFTALDVARAAAEQSALYETFLEFMKDFDILICPAVAVPPFPVDTLYPKEIDGRPMRTYYHWFAITYGLTLTAHPVIVIPCGRDESGTPFGIQICGRRHDDWRLLAIAGALEAYLQTLPALSRPVVDLEGLRQRAAETEEGPVKPSAAAVEVSADRSPDGSPDELPERSPGKPSEMSPAKSPSPTPDARSVPRGIEPRDDDE